MSKQHELGVGIFAWDGRERRTVRYGAVNLCRHPYNGSETVDVVFHGQVAERLRGQLVRLTCEVIATRTSGHVGDAFLGIKPSTPALGEVVYLGVGLLDIEDGWSGASPSIVLRPDDGRAKLWIDPRKLYRLHDQTVRLLAQRTKDKCTPPPDLDSRVADEAIDNGDGTFQVQTEATAAAIAPTIKRLGDGLFVVGPARAGQRGTRHKIVTR